MYNTSGLFGGGRMKIGGGYNAGPTWGGAQPMAAPGYNMAVPPGFAAKDADGNAAAPAAGPGNTPMNAPPAMDAPMGNMMFQRPGPFTSVPFNQTFGGQPAPYADLTAQQLDARHVMNSGAGRFGSNMAARYGYAGGMAGWRPDSYTPGSQIPGYGYQPRAPFPGMYSGQQYMPKGQFGINPPPGGLGQPPSRMPFAQQPPRTGGLEPNPFAPPRTGGLEPNPFAGGVPPQPPPPAGAVGAKSGFTQPMMNLSGMDAAQVAQLMGTAKDDGQRIAMASAFQAAQNPHADSFLNNLYGGDAQRKTMQQRYLEANASQMPVWDAKNNSFMSQQDYYAKQMGWK